MRGGQGKLIGAAVIRAWNGRQRKRPLDALCNADALRGIVVRSKYRMHIAEHCGAERTLAELCSSR